MRRTGSPFIAALQVSGLIAAITCFLLLAYYGARELLG
jgi:hypothetical protein